MSLSTPQQPQLSIRIHLPNRVLDQRMHQRLHLVVAPGPCNIHAHRLILLSLHVDVADYLEDIAVVG